MDCSKMDLNKLRRAVPINTQEPVLFSGTIRFNLDPFHKHKEEMLIDALYKCLLRDFVEKTIFAKKRFPAILE